MFGLKRINELEKQLEFYKGKVDGLTKELTEVKSSVYKYKRLFSNLFDRLQLTGVKSYKVYKSLTDGKVLFDIEYQDGTCYTYKVDLTATSYCQTLKGEVIKND